MISMKALSSASGAAQYHCEQNTQQQAAYYSDEVVRSSWGGRGAESLGLSGSVSKEEFIRVLEGHVTDRDALGNETDRQLGRQTADGTLAHRAGWDMTFSAPKSVSIASEVWGEASVRQAHEHAVHAAMDYLESHATQTRVSGERVSTGNLVYAEFQHSISRDVDPQTHTHVIIANATAVAQADGSTRWYSLSNEQLMQLRTTADMVYHNELASQLQERGFEVTLNERGHAELGQYTQAQLEAFSSRSSAIDAALEARGIDPETATYQQRQVACLATRQAKDIPDSAVMQREAWQAEAEAVGALAPRLVEHQQYSAHDKEVAAQQALASALAHLTERESAFSERELYQSTLRFAEGKTDYANIGPAIQQGFRDGELLSRGDYKITTREAVAAEAWAEQHLEAGKGAHVVVMTPEDYSKALVEFEARKGFALTDEQRSAAGMILTQDDKFSGVQGLAGTGKTTMLELVREAAESRGWEVRGFSNGASQAMTMQEESGIQSSTTAKHLLTEEKKDLGTAETRQTLWVMDEAGQSGQREFNRVIATSERAGAKTVFLGDSSQHQGVEAGRAFEEAQKHMPTAEMRQINRQKTEHTKAAVADIVQGRHSEAVRGLSTTEIRTEHRATIERFSGQQGGIEQRRAETGVILAADKAALDQHKADLKQAATTDNQHVINRLASDYTAMDAAQRQSTLVLTATNSDRQAINEAVRDQLKAGGALGEGVTIQILRQSDMTRAEQDRAGSYRQGQVVEFQSGYKRFGVEQGERGTVTAINRQHNVLTLAMEDGRTVKFQPDRTQHAVYQQQEREFAPGDRVSFYKNDREQEIKNGDVATIKAVDSQQMTVQLDKGGERVVDLSAYRQIDHAYATTSHRSQGMTVDRVMIHHNTEAGRHGDRETYVNVTRARHDVHVYTQDAEKAARQSGTALNKESAREHLAENSRAGQSAGQNQGGVPQRQKDFGAER